MKLPHLLFRKDGGVFLLPHVASLAFCTLSRVFGNMLTIHRTIDERAIFGAVEIPGVRSLRHMEIGYLDIADRLLIVAIVEDGISFRLLCGDVEDVEVFVLCGEVASAITEVIGFKAKDGTEGLFDGDVADMDVAYETAAILVRLEIERILHRAYANAVHPDSLHPATHLRTDTEAVAFALEIASTDDDTLRGTTHPASIGIATGLDGHGIVSATEEAVLNQHVARRLGIAAVVVGEMRVDGDAAHDDVVAIERMNGPKWRILDGDTFDEDA